MTRASSALAVVAIAALRASESSVISTKAATPCACRRSRPHAAGPRVREDGRARQLVRASRPTPTRAAPEDASTTPRGGCPLAQPTTTTTPARRAPTTSARGSCREREVGGNDERGMSGGAAPAPILAEAWRAPRSRRRGARRPADVSALLPSGEAYGRAPPLYVRQERERARRGGDAGSVDERVDRRGDDVLLARPSPPPGSCSCSSSSSGAAPAPIDTAAVVAASPPWSTDSGMSVLLGRRWSPRWPWRSAPRAATGSVVSSALCCCEVGPKGSSGARWHGWAEGGSAGGISGSVNSAKRRAMMLGIVHKRRRSWRRRPRASRASVRPSTSVVVVAAGPP